MEKAHRYENNIQAIIIPQILLVPFFMEIFTFFPLEMDTNIKENQGFLYLSNTFGIFKKEIVRSEKIILKTNNNANATTQREE